MAFLDSIEGVIARRVLLNYRVDPDVVSKILPPQFTPKLYRGHSVVGVCMIRFESLHPRFLPKFLGIGSENAAHRYAVEWQVGDERKDGVFIPRRDTNSFFNQALGGRVFPGIFNRSEFETQESADRIGIRIKDSDDGKQTEFIGRVASDLNAETIFESLDDASKFFLTCSNGYSATHREGHYQGMELAAKQWNFEPMTVELAKSHYFDDRKRFPEGSIELDSAFLMRNIEHSWSSRPDLYAGENPALLYRR